MNLLTSLGIILIFIGIYIMVRTDMIYNFRIKNLKNNYIIYQKLPSYNYMLWHFWIWSLDKFLPKKVDNETN